MINFHKKQCLPVITWNEKHSSKQVVPIKYTLHLALVKVCGSFLFRQSKKTLGIFWSVRVIFAFLEVRRRNKYCFVRGKFSFLYAHIWFDVTKCKFIVKYSSFKMLVAFSPIFVADTNITFVYNFVAPLTRINFLLTKQKFISFD